MTVKEPAQGVPEDHHRLGRCGSESQTVSCSGPCTEAKVRAGDCAQSSSRTRNLSPDVLRNRRICIGPHAAPVYLSAGAEHLDLQALITHAAQRPVILRARWVSTTTYGHGSTGIHKDLTTSPQNKKPTDKGQTGSNGGLRKRGTARYESEGRTLESCRARLGLSCKWRGFPCADVATV
jgi:hypothetical protein